MKFGFLSLSATQEEAAEAYDIAAVKYRGLSAVTNFDLSRYIGDERIMTDKSTKFTDQVSPFLISWSLLFSLKAFNIISVVRLRKGKGISHFWSQFKMISVFPFLHGLWLIVKGR